MAAVPDSDGDRGKTASRFGAGPGLRFRAARGTIVNAIFLGGVNGLALVKGIAVAGILSTAQYGTWGLLMAAFMTILTLGQVGVDDKYVQQDDADQRRAFEIAFTFQTAVGVVFTVALLVGMPLFALLYGRSSMIAPGMAFAAAMPALVLQMPLWVHYRRMDFARQRALQAIDPVVSLIAVVGFAVAGLGVWALVCGELLGTWCAALAVVVRSPYRLRLRWEPAALREYVRFSWPLLLGALATVIIVQVPVTVSARLLGVGAVAALALGANLTQFTTRVDDVVTQTLYPAICAVADRRDLLHESFWKTNRLALLWAAPLGGAAALFAGDFVHDVIGERWRFAVTLLELYGVNAALNQIGFNWTAFLRARGETRPVAIVAAVQLAATLALAVPGLVIDGLTGFGLGLCAATLVTVWLRLVYVRRLIGELPVAAHVIAGLGPSLPAVGAVLAFRALDAPTGLAVTLAEAGGYAILVTAVTLISQRALLRESLSYLRRRAVPVAPAPDGEPAPPGGPAPPVLPALTGAPSGGGEL